MKTIIYTLSIIVLFSACKSVDKMVQKGNYNAAFSLAIEKLSKQKKTKTEDLKTLEKVFVILNDRDVSRINDMLERDNDQLWDNVIRDYGAIERRQFEINTLMPLKSKDGYVPHFDFINTDFYLDEHITTWEKSVRRMNERDLDKMNRYFQGADQQSWKKGYYMFNTMIKRQQYLAAFLPIVDTRGEEAQFDFINIDYLPSESVLNLEQAFENMKTTNLYNLTSLLNGANASDWARFFKTYKSIIANQSYLMNYMPIQGIEGYRAQFDFIPNGGYLKDHIVAMEISFAKYIKDQLRLSENLITNQSVQDYNKALKIYNQIDDKQDLINQYLPMTSFDGYRAQFKFIKTVQLRKKAKDALAENYYQEAKDYLAEAKRGNKYAGQQAFYTLKKIDDIYTDYKDKEALIELAYQLGQTRVLIKLNNQSHQIIPRDMKRQLLNIDIQSMNAQWRKFYTAKSKYKMDIVASFIVERIDISPERELVRTHIESKEVKDGWRYILDVNGNVLKDTLGNDIKEDVFKVITAEVATIGLEKYLDVFGTVQIKTIDRKVLLNKPLDGHAGFDEHYVTFSGNKRALSKKTKKRLSSPIPFPSDEEMLFTLVDELSHNFHATINNFF